jgi:hypothetical protein
MAVLHDDAAQALDLAQQNLAALRSLAESGGFACSDVIGPPFAVRFCVGGPGPRRFVMVSVLAFDAGEHTAVLTTPVLKDVTHRPNRQFELRLVSFCNELTRDDPAHPCVLHRTDEGADVLIKQTFPYDLLIRAPKFFRATLDSLPSVASVARERAADAGITGATYGWGAADLWRLSTRSMF